jgi:hypothetical protein
MSVTTLDVSHRSHGAEDGVGCAGVSNDVPSTTFPHTLTINMDKSTTVSESASDAAVGSEGSVLCAANVASNFEVLVPAGESVSIHVGTSSCTATTCGSGNWSCSTSKGALASDNSARDVNSTFTNTAGTTSETLTLVVTA